ncbi:FliO/MopB family protein [Roseateles terrae]|uniref:Flagellar protein FliO/FliZ n=1 Tax=Roseateles terrae TaxID=431060 RepID=A0ABR6GZF9_9BURK|nr:flagellar biosynthetic protein FliO [Roseateles terrae]MBB3196513.1 flagellar protein FliO/FliZ [Roseateles terrae]OWQ83010.1 flagellar biogenesis protein [Roseateles terrae]
MNTSLAPLLWFLAILALIPVVLWLLKRTPLGGAALGGHLRTVAQLVIAPSQRIVIVEVGQGDDRQWLVLGITGQQIRTLHVMPPQADVGAALQSAQPSFAHMLKRSLGGRQADGTGTGL